MHIINKNPNDQQLKQYDDKEYWTERELKFLMNGWLPPSPNGQQLHLHCEDDELLKTSKLEIENARRGGILKSYDIPTNYGSKTTVIRYKKKDAIKWCIRKKHSIPPLFLTINNKNETAKRNEQVREFAIKMTKAMHNEGKKITAETVSIEIEKSGKFNSLSSERIQRVITPFTPIKKEALSRLDETR